MTRAKTVISILMLLVLCGCTGRSGAQNATRDGLPQMAWDHLPEAIIWTRATLGALNGHGTAMLTTVPDDIADFCPAYPNTDPADRAAFWAGMLSILAKMESTWQADVEGGGGRWIGLMQIAPTTAHAFECDATTRDELKNGTANLSCAVRIASAQVVRDNAVMSNAGNWRGLARDWAPFRNPKKRAEMTDWIRQQSYCRL